MTEWHINGRFLTQPQTGVQRYAREIVVHIDEILAREAAAAGESFERVSLLVPGEPHSPPELTAIEIRTTLDAPGHLWEQSILPAHARGPLLNLGNTGPLVHGREAVCIHDVNVLVQPKAYSRSFRTLYAALLPRLARRARVVTTVSADARRQLERYGVVEPGKALVVPNGHEHVFRWDPRRSDVLSRLPPDRPFVLLLGARAPHKNARLILGLAGELDLMGIDIAVAGRTLGLFSEMGAMGAPNVHELGAVTDDDLAALYGRALALCFPSLAEGFGLPVLEAMALWCPVISSDRASLPEICGEAALLAPPDQPQVWLAHIRALVAEGGLRDRLSQGGPARARLFSWRDSARRYISIMRGLCSDRRRGSHVPSEREGEAA